MLGALHGFTTIGAVITVGWLALRPPADAARVAAGQHVTDNAAMGPLGSRLLAGAVATLIALSGCAAATGTPSPGPAAPPAPTSVTPGAAASPAPAARSSAGSSPRAPDVDPESGLPWVAESALPAQARRTLALIRAGGPYPFPRNDDQTFGNREGLLPSRPAGYYKEYTVVTPGENDRGPRRIVCGRGGERYYTEDHYESFRRIREGT